MDSPFCRRRKRHEALQEDSTAAGHGAKLPEGQLHRCMFRAWGAAAAQEGSLYQHLLHLFTQQHQLG